MFTHLTLCVQIFISQLAFPPHLSKNSSSDQLLFQLINSKFLVSPSACISSIPRFSSAVWPFRFERLGDPFLILSLVMRSAIRTDTVRNFYRALSLPWNSLSADWKTSLRLLTSKLLVNCLATLFSMILRKKKWRLKMGLNFSYSSARKVPF